jgi:hypothetical protein
MIDSDEVALGTLRPSLERAGALDRGRAEAVCRRARLGAARARVGGAARRIGAGAGRGTQQRMRRQRRGGGRERWERRCLRVCVQLNLNNIVVLSHSLGSFSLSRIDSESDTPAATAGVGRLGSDEKIEYDQPGQS